MTSSGLPALHPSDFLREILEEIPMSEVEFALAIDIAPEHLSAALRGA